MALCEREGADGNPDGRDNSHNGQVDDFSSTQLDSETRLSGHHYAARAQVTDLAALQSCFARKSSAQTIPGRLTCPSNFIPNRLNYDLKFIIPRRQTNQSVSGSFVGERYLLLRKLAC